MSNDKMVNVVLVGGKYAGLKTRVPAGMRVLNIPDPDKAPDLTDSVVDLRAHLDAARTEQLVKGGPVNLSDCDNPYLLLPCVVTLPSLNDVLSFTIGAPPGTNMTDAFMQIVAGYCLLARPGDYEGENDGT